LPGFLQNVEIFADSSIDSHPVLYTDASAAQHSNQIDDEVDDEEDEDAEDSG